MCKNVVLAIDLDDENSWSSALPRAIELAHGGALHLVNVVPDFGYAVVGQYFDDGAESEMLENTRQRLHAFAEQHVPADILSSCLIGHGPIHSEILRMAAGVEADLVVVVAHKPGIKDYLMGPTAAHVVRHAETSVQVIRN